MHTCSVYRTVCGRARLSVATRRACVVSLSFGGQSKQRQHTRASHASRPINTRAGSGTAPNMSQRRASQIPAPGGASGIPRIGGAPASGLPRPSSSAAPPSGLPSATAIRNGTRSAMPERRTYASGLPAPGAPRPLALAGAAGDASMIGAGHKRRASQSYITSSSTATRPMPGRATPIGDAPPSDVFEHPLHDAQDGPPSAKRPFGHSSRLSNASSFGGDVAGQAPDSAKKSARESLTSIADISAVRHDYQVRLVHADARNGELERELLDKTRQLERFQRERLEMLQEWETLQTQKRAREEEHLKETEGLRKELKYYREMLGVSEADLERKTTELDALKQSAHQRATALEHEAVELRSGRDAAEAERQRLQKQLADMSAEVKELRDAANRKDPTMTMGRRALAVPDSSEDAAAAEALRKELHRQVSHLKKLEASQASLTSENSRLKAQLESIEVLKEEKRGLESRVRQLDMRNLELLSLEEDARKAREEVEKWEACLQTLSSSAQGAAAGSSDDDLRAALRIAEATSSDLEGDGDTSVSSALTLPARPTPFNRHTLPSYLSTLESSLGASLSKLRGVLQLLRRAADEKRALEAEAEAAERRSLEAEVNTSKARNAAERAELAAERARDETERYKALLDSFQLEQKIKKSSFDEANVQRIDLLTAQLEEARAASAKVDEETKALREQLATLESQLQQAQAAQASAAGAAPVSAADSEEAAATIAALEKELQALGEENEKLWARVGRGEFDQSKFQVLTLAANPLDQARDLSAKRLDALKEENDALLARIDALSSQLTAAGGAQPAAAAGSATAEGDSAVPRAVVDSLKMELSAVQKELADKDKMFLRLRQVYASKATEFRDVVTSLFGWKLKFMENGKVKLTSSFSRSGNATTLVFQSGEGDEGSMRLMGEATKEGLADVQGLRDKWLAGKDAGLQSIPCFLAELNQQLFESCTRVARAYGYLPDDAGS